MIVSRALSIFALALAAASCAPSAVQDGVYSDVIYSEETGDQGGAILRIESGKSQVGFYLCEGGCNDLQIVPALTQGNVITFTAMDQGDVGRVRFRAVAHGDRVILTSPDLKELRAELRRLSPGETIPGS